jgi:hypothetical protein
MSSSEGIPIHQVIIYLHIFNFLLTNHWSRYLPKFPNLPSCTYLSSCLSNRPCNYRKQQEEKQNEDIARNLKLFTRAIFKLMTNIFC